MSDVSDLFKSKFGRYILVYILNDIHERDENKEDAQELADSLLEFVGAKPGAYNNFDYLGFGSFAMAFWCKNDRKKVLKITSDEDDAKACAILAKRPDKSLLKVYKVASIPTTKFYAILVEKLSPLSGSQKKMWENALLALPKLHSEIKYQGLQESSLDSVKRQIEYEEKYKETHGKMKFVEMVKKVLPTLELWADKLAEERGIIWRDLHIGNIMMRGRIPIISDLGVSRVKGSPSIPELSI